MKGIKPTTNFKKILGSNKVITICQGGSSSGKTYAILQLLYLIAVESKVKLLISVVSESLPHLKRGCITDFENILEAAGHIVDRNNNNKSDKKYKVGKSIIEFFSADKPTKLRGSRRDILYINECNNIAYESFYQLAMRTKKKVYIDYNPTSEFWVHTEIIGSSEFDYDFIKTTYKDNEYCPTESIKFIESRRIKDPEWYKTYGLGEIGTLEGLIYKEFSLIDVIPNDAVFLGYGKDFGFSNDQTTLVGTWIKGNNLYCKEFIYEKGLTDADIIARYEHHRVSKKDYIVADVNPSSIETIRRAGYNIIKAIKGDGSILFGINKLKEYNIHVTKDSLNLIIELRHYRWKTDITGKTLNEPIDTYNHILDALRYIVAYSALNKKRAIVVSNNVGNNFKYK